MHTFSNYQSEDRALVGHVEPSDDDIERWFAQHRRQMGDTTIAEIAYVAAWLPLIGPPANDRAFAVRVVRNEDDG
jgi:hypothetical protein